MSKLKTTSKIYVADSLFETIYSLDDDYNSRLPLVTVHLKMHALTFHVKNLLYLNKAGIEKLNQKLISVFPNSLYYISSCEDNIWLSLNHNPILDLIEKNMALTDQDTITIQGRSWEDHCLKIINLNQNYRWEQTYQY